jgi:hydroxymethylpyrimidine pyrophosphatase-like HAD family hydrolase
MRYLVLCCDYDGTLAHHGRVDDPTVAALERVIQSGRRLVLVTGRELDDLQRVMPRLDLFERVVAENGALVYTPSTREEVCLADPPSPALIDLLRARGVSPLSVGRAIVATWEPHERTVLDSIHELGLELHVIFNKGAVMVLPSGVNKATGLAAALDRMSLSPRNAVGVGDAENDHAFLAMVECSVAVANALPILKEKSDIVTKADHGAGVVELIEEILADDLAKHAPRLARHLIPLGRTSDDQDLQVEPCGASVLVAGTSGSGKSSVAKGLIERIVERGYSFCVIDPEGDYDALNDAVTIGTADRAPSLDEAMQLLERRVNATVNLVGLPIADRPAYFIALLPRILALRERTGHPHWLILDEAHHLMPAEAGPAEFSLPERLGGVMQISVHPDLIAPDSLAGVDTMVVVGNDPAGSLRRFAEITGQGIQLPQDKLELEKGEVLVWMRERGSVPARVRTIPGRAEHRRHVRKYAEGELPPDRSFYFRGPDAKLNLRAQNLIVFLQMADGVGDETWEFHRTRGDYSRWIEEGIKDEALTQEVRRIEALRDVPPAETRAMLRKAIEELYTLPA